MTRIRILLSILAMIVLGTLLFVWPFRMHDIHGIGAFLWMGAMILFIAQTVEINIVRRNGRSITIGIHPSSPTHSNSSASLSYEAGAFKLCSTVQAYRESIFFDETDYSGKSETTTTSKYRPSLAVPTDTPDEAGADQELVLKSVRNEDSHRTNPTKPQPA